MAVGPGAPFSVLGREVGQDPLSSLQCYGHVQGTQTRVSSQVTLGTVAQGSAQDPWSLSCPTHREGTFQVPRDNNKAPRHPARE